ncbi:M23 family metallopeptidase [Streptomyces cinereoruber]|uniref:M23 family metallopeptidase n=1 Tax=Streptomyces cinereoruber TaxID=67260 RepID=UPI003C2D0154
MPPASATAPAARPSLARIRALVTVPLAAPLPGLLGPVPSYAALPARPLPQKGAAGNDVADPRFLPRRHGGTARLDGGRDGSCGPGVAIDGDGGVRRRYCRLDSRPVGDGTRVTAGRLIALTGDTGDSTGPHPHFGILRQGDSVCPQQMPVVLHDGLAPPSPWTPPDSGRTY